MSSMVGMRGMQGSGGSPKGQKLAGYDVQQVQQYTPEQMQLFQQMFKNVSPDSQTAKLAAGDESAFQQMEAPAYRDFNALQGNIASRFSGAGTGSRRSSGFQNTMAQEGSNFAMDLQSRRQQLMRQAMQDLHGMSSELLDKRPYETYYTEPKEKKSFMQKILGGALPIAGTAFGLTPWGAATGGPAAWGAIGSSAGRAFS